MEKIQVYVLLLVLLQEIILPKNLFQMYMEIINVLVMWSVMLLLWIRLKLFLHLKL